MPGSPTAPSPTNTPPPKPASTPSTTATTNPPTSPRSGMSTGGCSANGWCTRPRSTDCSFEAICEGCGYFETGPEFAPTLHAQHDHAAAHGQTTRVELYGALLERLESSQ